MNSIYRMHRAGMLPEQWISGVEGIVPLASETPLAIGSKRLVFQHPLDRSLLIKVMRPEFSDKRLATGLNRLWVARRYHYSATFVREVREMIEVRFELLEHPTVVQRIVGFAETDLGLGMVSLAARGPDGNLAPTLNQMIKANAVDADARQALQRFCDDVLECPIVVGDLHTGNIVYAYNEQRGHHFVMIDGIGDKTLIPLLRLFPRLRARSKRRKIRWLWAKVDGLPRKGFKWW
jgi:hypothetical protein